MNTNRLINMGMRLFMRFGMKHVAKRFSKGQPADPNAKRAQQAARTLQRTNRMR